MPNHSYSVLKFIYHEDSGEKIQEIKNFLSGENSVIDFNKIIPVPEHLISPDPNVLSDEEKKWCVENWGTKWNAYQASIVTEKGWALVYRFTTAWNYPAPIIKKLHDLFKGVEITFLAADDGGWFAYKEVRDEENKTKTFVWNNHNDTGGEVREAIFEALNINY